MGLESGDMFGRRLSTDCPLHPPPKPACLRYQIASKVPECVICKYKWMQIEAIRPKNPEQIAFIGAQSAGSDYNNRTMLKLTDLIQFYFNGPLTVGPEGDVNLADEQLMYQPVRS